MNAKMCLVLRIIPVLLTCVRTEITVNDAFLEPIRFTEDEESYVYGDTEYVIVAQRSSWQEAELICSSEANGSFALITSVSIANFLAEVLAESILEPEILWVGANRETENSTFRWTNGIEVLKDHLIIRGPEVSKPIRNCLAMSRVSHSVPLFVNLECHIKRQILCEKPYDKPLHYGSMTTPDWITIGKYKYGIFYDKITFSQAIRACTKHDYAHLASFRNNEEVRIISKFMLIGRPSLERAFIGGKYNSGQWSFVSGNTILKAIPDKETRFPPWRYGRSTKHSGCLSLDRHVLSEAHFLEGRCVRKQSYICEKETSFKPDYVTLIVGKIGYVLYYILRTWDLAQEQCETHGGRLAVVDQNNIHDVINLMGENYTEIRHVWIGGRLGSDGQFFYWHNTKDKIIPKRVQIKFYPPWYDIAYERQFACLNMDRENHNFPIFYGADCDVPQPFVCSQTNLTLFPKPSLPAVGVVNLDMGHEIVRNVESNKFV